MKLAESYFRVRNYTVQCTSELPVGADFKLDSLSSLVLKVVTKDGYFTFNANILKITTNDNS